MLHMWETEILLFVGQIAVGNIAFALYQIS